MTAHRYKLTWTLEQVLWFLIHAEDSATVLPLLVTCFCESKVGKCTSLFIWQSYSSGKTDMRKVKDIGSQRISLDTNNILAKATQNLEWDFLERALLFSL